MRKPYVRPPSPPPKPLAEPARATLVRADEAHVEVPKFTYLRSAPYRRYVAALPCFVCGIAGHSQAAHPNQSKFGKGRSIKADQFVWPMCAPNSGHMGCHHAHDHSIVLSQARRDEAEDRFVQRMQELAVEAGWNLQTLRRI